MDIPDNVIVTSGDSPVDWNNITLPEYVPTQIFSIVHGYGGAGHIGTELFDTYESASHDVGFHYTGYARNIDGTSSREVNFRLNVLWVKKSS